MITIKFKPGFHLHYKGGNYYAFWISYHHDSLIPMVQYRSDDHHAMKYRELDGAEGWFTEVQWPDGKMRPRFINVADAAEFGVKQETSC